MNTMRKLASMQQDGQAGDHLMQGILEPDTAHPARIQGKSNPMNLSSLFQLYFEFKFQVKYLLIQLLLS